MARNWRLTVVLAFALALIGGNVAQGVEPRTWESRYDWPAGHGYQGWQHATHAADADAYGFATGFPDRPGLWLWPAGDREHRPGSGDWVFTAPGTTRVASATLAVDYAPKLFAHHCLAGSLRAAGQVRNEVEHCKPANTGGEHRVDIALADPITPAQATETWISVSMPVCRNPADKPCSKHLPAHDPQMNGPFARSAAIDMVLIDDDLPEVVTDADMRDRYVDGRDIHPVQVRATDAGSGVRSARLAGAAVTPAGPLEAACDWTHRTAELGANICPAASRHQLEIDARDLAEGAHEYAARATDLAGHEATEAAWRLLVDRTAPPAPAEFELHLDEEADTALITWVAADDPALADGTPGSGLGTSEHRFWHPRMGWSDWHQGAQTVEIPDSLQGDTVKLEARQADQVGNWSPLATATLEVPLSDEEEDFEENLDDDLPEEDDSAPAARTAGFAEKNLDDDRHEKDDSVPVARAAAFAAESSTLSIQAVSAADRREAALDEVRRSCVRQRSKAGCYRAVESACRVGGICGRAKEIACQQVRLYCVKADASRVSLFDRFQPNFKLAVNDMFYPVPFGTALKLRWGKFETELKYGDRTLATGAKDIKEHLQGMQGTDDNLYLDYPADKASAHDQFRSTLDALKIPRTLDVDQPNSDEQWQAVYDASRIYWYRGGGFGRNPGPEGTVKTLQYWTFHTYNYLPSDIGNVGKHEGDAEMVAVALSRDNEPKYFYMSRHGMKYVTRPYEEDEQAEAGKEAMRLGWNDPRLSKLSDRVNVHSSIGSHAMYYKCGKQKRNNLPDDNSPCDPKMQLNFNRERTRRIPLGRQPWACWGGLLGEGGGGGLYSSAPKSPLWQQSVFRGDPHPCKDGDPSAPTVATVARAARAATAPRRAPRASAAQEDGADPLVDQFRRCEYWYQSPTQPGAEVVACDQAQMDHYFASGLTDPGPGGAVLAGPGMPATKDIPAVYHSSDPADLAKVTATGSGHAVGLYASQFDASGLIREAVFAPVAIPDGEKVRVRWNGEVAELVRKDGTVLATATVQREKTTPRRVIRRPGGLRVKRTGSRAAITFKAQRGVRFAVSAGRTRSLAGSRLLKTSGPSARRMVVRLRRKDRWLEIYGFTTWARGDAVKVRVRRR